MSATTRMLAIARVSGISLVGPAAAAQADRQWSADSTCTSTGTGLDGGASVTVMFTASVRTY